MKLGTADYAALAAIAAGVVTFLATAEKARKAVWAALGWLNRRLNPFAVIMLRFDKIDAQLTPNGGASLRDQVDALVLQQAIDAGRVSLMLDHSPMLIWESAPDGRQTRANETLVALTGRSAAELLGWGWLNIIHPDDREGLLKHWAEAREHVRPFEGVYRFVDVEGHVYVARLLAKPTVRRDQVVSWTGLATATPQPPAKPRPRRRSPRKPRGEPA